MESAQETDERYYGHSKIILKIPLKHYFSFQRSPNSIHALDGLRGIAILLVLGRHAVKGYFPNNYNSDKEWSFWNFLANGWMGVDLFFVLSGFLISYHIAERYISSGKNINYKDFIKRRFLRIAPTYYFVLFLIIAGMIPLYNIDDYNITFRIAYHLMFLQDYFPADINVAFWSLGVEEKFYLVAPFILLAIFKIKKPILQYATLILLLISPMLLRMLSAYDNPLELTYVTYFYMYRSPFHLTFDGLATGMLCALIYSHKKENNFKTNSYVGHLCFWIGFLAISTMMLYQTQLNYISKFNIIYMELVLACGFGFILIGVLFNGGPNYILKSRILFYLSKISYPLYLIHLSLIPISIYLIKYIPIINTDDHQNNFYIFTFIFFSLSTIISIMIHFTVEKPFLLLKDNTKST